jgi:hypothetical protein
VSWTLDPSPDPVGATGSLLIGVTCPSATSCTSVGYSFQSEDFGTLVEQASPASPPAFTSPTSTTFRQGAAGSFTVAASGSPAPAITESGALPSGLTLTDNGDGTATITGTPTTSGSFPILLTAHNGVGSDATQALAVTVYPVATVTGAVPSAVAEGTADTVVLDGTGLESGASVTFTGPSAKVVAVAASIVTTGSTLSTTVKVPEATPIGAYTVTVTNVDGSTGTCAACLTIIPAPTLTGLSPSSAARGSAVPVTLSGTGFASGATVKGPSGVRFTKVDVIAATTITATMTVASGATPGTALGVTVTDSAAAGGGHVTGRVLTIT